MNAYPFFLKPKHLAEIFEKTNRHGVNIKDDCLQHFELPKAHHVDVIMISVFKNISFRVIYFKLGKNPPEDYLQQLEVLKQEFIADWQKRLAEKKKGKDKK